MSSGSNSGGLMSSAGLVRYFDNQGRDAITMNPKTVLAFCVLFGVFVQILSLTVA
ncbi:MULTISPECIES: preprotein translocase subunit Sec61beta [Halorubrum]|uniref:Preprotein translocase subunit SecG n=2 Tax=Halorubrum TaxID=56688 RepID=A0ABD5T9C8_9EURY|nr:MULTISPECIES: preprotein translocase subunit Sec61beta [Halorubrum]TKX79435.1 preprotein translocase subunit Sec61beta [Halorubrum sp. SD626R]